MARAACPYTVAVRRSAAALVLGSFRSAVADWNDVPTGSMRPTVLEGAEPHPRVTFVEGTAGATGLETAGADLAVCA